MTLFNKQGIILQQQSGAINPGASDVAGSVRVLYGFPIPPNAIQATGYYFEIADYADALHASSPLFVVSNSTKLEPTATQQQVPTSVASVVPQTSFAFQLHANYVLLLAFLSFLL
jgi:hypothetical protein